MEWSPGNQFYFLEGFAWSVSLTGSPIRFDAKEVEQALSGIKTGNQSLDNLITLDYIEKMRLEGLTRTTPKSSHSPVRGINRAKR